MDNASYYFNLNGKRTWCALSRVAGLFSARGYNIESLTVATTEDATLLSHDDCDKR